MRRTEASGCSRSRKRHLIQIQFAEEDHARVAQPPGYFGVFGWHAILEHLRRRSSTNALGINVVFERDRHAVEWPEDTPAAPPVIGFARLPDSGICLTRDESVQLTV